MGHCGCVEGWAVPSSILLLILRVAATTKIRIWISSKDSYFDFGMEPMGMLNRGLISRKVKDEAGREIRPEQPSELYSRFRSGQRSANQRFVKNSVLIPSPLPPPLPLAPLDPPRADVPRRVADLA